MRFQQLILKTQNHVYVESVVLLGFSQTDKNRED